MFAVSHRHTASQDAPWKFRPGFEHRDRTTPIFRGIVAFVGCLLVGIPADFAAPAPTPVGSRTPAPLLSDDGFTRESLQEFNAPPEPVPFTAAPAAASVEEAHSKAVAVRHRRRLRRPAPAAQTPSVVVSKVSRHRGPVVSFIYWWNGWVIRNFHTTFGTVLLGTIGAKA